MLDGLNDPETDIFPPTDRLFVTVALFKVELPAFNVPRVDVPVTPKVPLKLMLAGLNDPLVVRFPVIFTPADELVVKFIF